MEKIKRYEDINTNTIEGKYLLVAMRRIMLHDIANPMDILETLQKEVEEITWGVKSDKPNYLGGFNVDLEKPHSLNFLLSFETKPDPHTEMLREIVKNTRGLVEGLREFQYSFEKFTQQPEGIFWSKEK